MQAVIKPAPAFRPFLSTSEFKNRQAFKKKSQTPSPDRNAENKFKVIAGLPTVTIEKRRPRRVCKGYPGGCETPRVTQAVIVSGESLRKREGFRVER